MEMEISKCKNTSSGNGDSFPPVPNYSSIFANIILGLITYRTLNNPGTAGVVSFGLKGFKERHA